MLNGFEYSQNESFYLILIICLYIVEWFQVLQSNTNIFICVRLIGFKYCYVTLTIQFNISYLFS